MKAPNIILGLVHTTGTRHKLFYLLADNPYAIKLCILLYRGGHIVRGQKVRDEPLCLYVTKWHSNFCIDPRASVE